jgi:hypothetical protein
VHLDNAVEQKQSVTKDEPMKNKKTKKQKNKKKQTQNKHKTKSGNNSTI